MDLQQLKQNILLLLKDQDLSIRGLEVKAGLTQSFINNLLSSRSKNPGIDAIIKIADALGVTIDELLGKKEKNNEFKINIERKDIFLKSTYHVLHALEEKTRSNLKFNMEKIFIAICEIYVFSLKEGSFDEEFAEWFVKSKLVQ